METLKSFLNISAMRKDKEYHQQRIKKSFENIDGRGFTKPCGPGHRVKAENDVSWNSQVSHDINKSKRKMVKLKEMSMVKCLRNAKLIKVKCV